MGRGLEGKEVEGAVSPEKPGIGGVTRLKEASGDHIRVWNGWGGIEIGWICRRIAESEIKVGLPDSDVKNGDTSAQLTGCLSALETLSPNVSLLGLRRGFLSREWTNERHVSKASPVLESRTTILFSSLVAWTSAEKRPQSPHLRSPNLSKTCPLLKILPQMELDGGRER